MELPDRFYCDREIWPGYSLKKFENFPLTETPSCWLSSAAWQLKTTLKLKSHVFLHSNISITLKPPKECPIKVTGSCISANDDANIILNFS